MDFNSLFDNNFDEESDVIMAIRRYFIVLMTSSQSSTSTLKITSFIMFLVQVQQFLIKVITTMDNSLRQDAVVFFHEIDVFLTRLSARFARNNGMAATREE